MKNNNKSLLVLKKQKKEANTLNRENRNMKIKKIIRSKRKTIALQVCNDSALIIKAPLRVSDAAIIEIVAKHSKWVEKKKQEVLSRNINNIEKKFVEGERFLYLGELYPLKIVQNSKSKIPLTLNGGYFYLQDNNINNNRDIFIAWYRLAARDKILQRAEWYAGNTGYRYKKAAISNAQKQWGSCTHSGNIYFPWRLIMAPVSVIDYVIVHELVHLVEKNHSKLFWDKVGLIMPDYKNKRKWLKEHGYLLTI